MLILNLMELTVVQKIINVLISRHPILKHAVSSYHQLQCCEHAKKHVHGTAEGPNIGTEPTVQSLSSEEWPLFRQLQCDHRPVEQLLGKGGKDELGGVGGRVELGGNETGGDPCCHILNPHVRLIHLHAAALFYAGKIAVVGVRG